VSVFGVGSCFQTLDGIANSQKETVDTNHHAASSITPPSPMDDLDGLKKRKKPAQAAVTVGETKLNTLVYDSRLRALVGKQRYRWQLGLRELPTVGSY